VCSAAAFHAQQAAEKALKAWLVAAGDDDPPPTHNLLRLARRLSRFGVAALATAPLRLLTPLAVAPRYDTDRVSDDTAREAVAEATDLCGTADQAVDLILDAADAASAQEADQ